MGQGLSAAVESVVHAYHRRGLRDPNHARWNRMGPPGPRRDPGLVHVEQSIMDLDRRGGRPSLPRPPRPWAPFPSPRPKPPPPPPATPPPAGWEYYPPSPPGTEKPGEAAWGAPPPP